MHPAQYNKLTDAYSVTIAEACFLSGVGKTKLYDEIRAGRLQTRKLGTRTLIRTDDLRAFIDALPSVGGASE